MRNRLNIIVLSTICMMMISLGLHSQCTNTTNNGVDFQSVSIDPATGTDPIEVGSSVLIGFGVNNNISTSQYVPSGDAVVTIGYPQSIVEITDGDIILQDFGGGFPASSWEIVPGSVQAGTFKIRNMVDFPINTGSIIAFSVTGTNVGGSDFNLTLNVNLDIESNCGDVNPNQTATGTLYVEEASPVTLLNFTAKSSNLDGALSWVTASEVDNDRFEIERSLDGKRFVKIGEVKGNGTTTSKQSYSYTDKGIGAQVNGRVYYRLHQVDYDGTSEDSEVRFINFGKGGMSVYPNPTTGSLRIDVPLTTSVVKVYNSVGELVKQSNHNSDDAFEISELVDGVYNIRVEDEQGEEIGTERIVKIK